MRRRTREVIQTKPTMDTARIGAMDTTDSSNPRFGPFVQAVLFASGELKPLERSSDVFGLVLAGYEGHQFGDDGTYTAFIASELPLERWNGVNKLEEEVNKAVREISPAYCAEHVGFIALDQAAVQFDVALKRELGVDFPSLVTWQGGSFSTGGTLPVRH